MIENVGNRLALEKDWDLSGRWEELLEGGSTLSIFGEVMYCNSIDGERCYRYVDIPISPGQKVVVRTVVRRISGDPSITIDLRQNNTAYTQRYINDDNLGYKQYRLDAIVPPNDNNEKVRVVIGLLFNDAGEAYFQDPEINLFGYPRRTYIGHGFITFDSDTPEAFLTDSHSRFNIDSVSYNSSSNQVEVTLGDHISGEYRPIVHLTGENNDVYIPQVQQIRSNPYEFAIQWTDGTQYIDPASAISGKTFVGFEVFS
jgi:hypothetical protein